MVNSNDECLPRAPSPIGQSKESCGHEDTPLRSRKYKVWNSRNHCTSHKGWFLFGSRNDTVSESSYSQNPMFRLLLCGLPIQHSLQEWTSVNIPHSSVIANPNSRNWNSDSFNRVIQDSWQNLHCCLILGFPAAELAHPQRIIGTTMQIKSVPLKIDMVTVTCLCSLNNTIPTRSNDISNGDDQEAFVE